VSNFTDVRAFHEKFKLAVSGTPSLLPPDLYHFRLNFMQEELNEFADAHKAGDLTMSADALIDLVYVVMGTAVLMGLPWEALWREVQEANMRKVRVPRPGADPTQRGGVYDVAKPEGWSPPDLARVLAEHGAP
jgi:predicted HAD superfamily Cof-like phosphohydrolase